MQFLRFFHLLEDIEVRFYEEQTGEIHIFSKATSPESLK